MNRTFLFLVITTLLGTSCVNTKRITYFQAEALAKDLEKQDIKDKYTIKLQPGDIINLKVSSLSPEANAMFNLYPESQVVSSNQTMQTTAPAAAIGFLVDEDGSITLPLAGKIKIGGLTTKEAAALVTKSLEKYLEQPTVNLRIINYKVSILGEVERPSVYTISNERITLPEALSLAGDMTIYGKRKNILVIREVDGKREFARVDITKRDVFNSPYYYLRPNDIVYVEPVKGRLTATSRTVQLTPLVLSALTFLTVVTVYIFK